MIGTGATAIQCVPFVGAYAEKLHVSSARPPPWIYVVTNKPTTSGIKAKSRVGSERGVKTLRRCSQARADGRPSGGWLDGHCPRIGLSLMNRKPEDGNLDMAEIALRSEIADFQKMNEIRARCDDEISDDAVADKLKPWYRQFVSVPPLTINTWQPSIGLTSS